MNIKEIKIIEDFPVKGIKFLDITRVMLNPSLMKDIVDKASVDVIDSKAQCIISPEARGFLFASPIASRINLPLFMLRKKGKLPDDGTQITFSAEKEYGKNSFCVNESDIEFLKKRGVTKICIVDDVLATGQTSLFLSNFFKSKGFEVVLCYNFIEIKELHGSELLQDNDILSKSYIKF